MSIIDDVRQEIRHEQEKYGATSADRINRAAEEAKYRIIHEIKDDIRHNRVNSHLFSKKKYVVVEMPPIYITSHEIVTPRFSRGGENSCDCYFVKTHSEKVSFLNAVQSKLEENGVSSSLKKSAIWSDFVLHCKYEWKD